MIPTPDGAQLWAAVSGSGPPVVMCHGGPGLWDYLGDLAALLDDEFTVYRWDQRACGRSSAGRAQVSTEQTLQDLDHLRTHFGHDRWTVLGHSWGAELALLYGLMFESRSTAVAYVSGRGTLASWRQAGRAASRAAMTRRMSPGQLQRLSTLTQLAVRDAAEEVQFRRLSWMTDFMDPDESEALRAMAEAPFAINVNVNRALASDHVLDEEALRQRCVATRVPMLMVHGSGDPRPIDGPSEVASWIPTATLQVVPGAAHLPWVEQPDLVRSTLKTFLRRSIAAPIARSRRR